MQKDQLFKTSGLQFDNYLFGPEKFSELSRNGPLVHDEPVVDVYRSTYMMLIHEIHVFVLFRSSNTCISCSNITSLDLDPSSKGLYSTHIMITSQLAWQLNGLSPASASQRSGFEFEFSRYFSLCYISNVKKKLRTLHTSTSFPSALQIRPFHNTRGTAILTFHRKYRVMPKWQHRKLTPLVLRCSSF